MNWIGRALLVGIFVMMATMTVSAYALMDGDRHHETVLVKNAFKKDMNAESRVTMADEPGLCLMFDDLDCFKTRYVVK